MPKGLVLVVEDDPATQLTIAEVLHGGGFAVVCAADEREARNILRALSPDAILVDYYLGHTTADPLVHYLRETGLTSKTALMTATIHPDILARRLKLKEILSKPFDLETLLETVTRLGMRRNYLVADKSRVKY